VAVDQARQGDPGATDGATGKAQEVATQAKEQVQEAKGRASERAREQLDTRSTQLGEQVTSFAEALRKAADHLREQGNEPGAKAAGSAAGQVERLSEYLTDSSSDRFLRDLETFGRRRPWAAGGVGAVLGFVAARFVKASSENRYESSRLAAYDAELPLSRDAEAATTPPPAGTLPYGSR